MLTDLPRSRHSRRTPSPFPLDDGTSVPESRLARVRGAGVAFLRGTTAGWSRRDLVDWLVCQYAPCAADPLHEDGDELSPAAERALDEGMIERVILDARARVLRLLGELVVPWQASPLARLSIASGAVVAQRDQRGGVAFSPVNLKRVRLAERVTSLFVADYLNRPNEYRWLMLCRECGEVAFSTELTHAPWCEAPAESWLAFTAAEAGSSVAL
jgi:hypothetical protein